MKPSSEPQIELKQTQIQHERELTLNAGLAALSKALFQRESLAELSSLILDYACRLTKSVAGYVGYIDPLTQYLVCTPLNDDVWKQETADGSLIFEEWRGLEGWVLHNKAPLLTNTPADDPRIPAFAEDSVHLQRFLSVPVLSGERLVGQITVANAEEAYSETDLVLIQHLAVLYAAALGRHRAEEAERKQRAFSDALRDILATMAQTLNLPEVFERVLTNVSDVIPYDAANLMLFQDDLLHVAYGRGYAERGLQDWIVDLRIPLESRPYLATSYAERRSIVQSDPLGDPATYTPEEAWIHSSITCPICSVDRVLGFINVYSSTPRFFDEEQAGFLQVFADQTAIAIQNATLFEAERRKCLLARMFQQIAEAMSMSKRLEDTLEFVLELLGDVVTYDHAEVLLVEGDNLRLVASRCEAGSSNRPESQAERLPYAEVPAFYEPMTSGEPLVLFDAQADQRWTRAVGMDRETRGWLGVPLIVWDIVLGLLSISSNQVDTYTQYDVEAAQVFARQVALAIENNHLYTRLETSEASLHHVRAHLTQTARLSVTGKIAASVAHQVNNPLTTVIAQTYLLLKQMAPDSPAYEAVETIRRATYQAGTVVQRLMEFARPSSYVMDSLDLNRTILNAISLIRAQVEPHIARITIDLAPDLPIFQGSEEHLEDVWINLILNARDALDGGNDGHIHVTTRFVRNHKTIKVMVEDNGTGIAQEHLSVIFDPLFTTKKHGTGLGLALCHDVVFDHGGKIQVTSQVGEGTTVTILLPV